jgi:hypothetical protein
MSRFEVVLAVLLGAGLVAAIVRIDIRLLRDLAETPDEQLAYLTRTGWTGIILLAFPIGPILYLRFGKVH